jgi:hypothetical protein
MEELFVHLVVNAEPIIGALHFMSVPFRHVPKIVGRKLAIEEYPTDRTFGPINNFTD